MRTRRTRTPTLAELEQHLATVACVVARHGDTYLPLFERLEREVEMARANASTRDRALRLAREMAGAG